MLKLSIEKGVLLQYNHKCSTKKEIALLMFSKSFLLISICFVNNILVFLKLNEELKSELDFATYFILPLGYLILSNYCLPFYYVIV